MELLDRLRRSTCLGVPSALDPFRRRGAAIYPPETDLRSCRSRVARAPFTETSSPPTSSCCRYGEDCDFVKVLDFGIAKSAGVHPRITHALTEQSVIHGTPAFIAPEQAMGRSDLDGRVDTLRHGLCRALAVDRPDGLRRRETPMALAASTRQHSTVAAVGPDRALDSLRPRSTRPVVAWPKTPRTGRSRPGNSRAASPRFRPRAPGPRIARVSGGRRTSRRRSRTETWRRRASIEYSPHSVGFRQPDPLGDRRSRGRAGRDMLEP